MEASHKTHRPHIKVGKDVEEEDCSGNTFFESIFGLRFSWSLLSLEFGSPCPLQCSSFLELNLDSSVGMDKERSLWLIENLAYIPLRVSYPCESEISGDFGFKYINDALIIVHTR